MKEESVVPRMAGPVLTGVALGILAVVAIGMALVKLAEWRVDRAGRTVSE